MPSALRASRSFASAALARLRSGVGAAESRLNQEGPEIKVEPFDAANVSTPAALIKLGTSIAAARRHRANFQAAQEDAALTREATRAQIAEIRARAAYYQGTGRKTGKSPWEPPTVAASDAEGAVSQEPYPFPAGVVGPDAQKAYLTQAGRTAAGGGGGGSALHQRIEAWKSTGLSDREATLRGLNDPLYGYSEKLNYLAAHPELQNSGTTGQSQQTFKQNADGSWTVTSNRTTAKVPGTPKAGAAPAPAPSIQTKPAVDESGVLGAISQSNSIDKLMALRGTPGYSVNVLKAIDQRILQIHSGAGTNPTAPAVSGGSPDAGSP